MEMSEQYNDERLTKLFLSESMDFDQDAMWSDIDASLSKKKRRPFFLIFFSTLFVGGLAFLYGPSFFQSSNEMNNKVATTTSVSASQKTDVESNTKSNSTINSVATSNTNENSAITSTPTTTLKSTNNSNANSNSTSSAASTSITKSTSTPYSNQTATTKSSLKIDNVANKSSNEKTSSSSSIKNEATTKKEAANSINQTQLNQTVLDNTITNKGIDAPISSNNLITTSSVNTTSNISQGNQVRQGKFVDVLSRDISLLNIEENDEMPPVRFKKDWSLCEIKQPWSLFAEAYGGYSQPLVSNSVRLVDDETSRSYLNLWEEAQSPVSGFQGGLHFVVQSPSGFEFMVGGEYQQIEEKVESETITTIRERIYDPMAYFIQDENGNIIYVGDTVTRTKITSEVRKTGLSHRLINIPLKVGYMLELDEWNIGAHVGAIFHINYQFDGVAILANGSYLQLDKSNQEKVYRKNLGLSYTANLHLGRQVSDNLEIFVRPEFRYHHEPWTSDQHMLSTKIQLAQLQGGIRYRIK